MDWKEGRKVYGRGGFQERRTWLFATMKILPSGRASTLKWKVQISENELQKKPAEEINSQ
jgi:hypothetical protein